MSDVAYLKELNKNIKIYFSTTIFSIGFVFNTMTILVFLRKGLYNNKTNMSLLYICLAIFDTLALFDSILFIQLFPAINLNIQQMSDFLCKFTKLWHRTTLQAPSWILCIISFDRYRTVCLPPNKLAFMKSKRNILIIILSINLILFLINSLHWAFYIERKYTLTKIFDVDLNKTINQSVLSSSACNPSSPIVQALSDNINSVMRAYVPFIIIFILNILLVKQFIQSKRKMQHSKMNSNNSSTTENSSSMSRREIYFTFSVISLNILFLILYTPWTIFVTFKSIFNSVNPNPTPLTNYIILIVEQVVISIAFLMNTSSFVFNFFFNKLFIYEIMRILKLKK